MTNTANLAELHFFGWTFFGWFLMAKVHRVGILRFLHFPFIFPFLLGYLLHPIVKLITRIIGNLTS